MEVGSLTNHLKHRGFTPCNIPGSKRLAYSGALTISDQRILLKIVFKSRYPTDFPDFYIRDWKTNSMLQQKLGVVNISSEGRLCYIDPGEFLWDSSCVSKFLEAAILRVEELLEMKLRGIVQNNLFIRDFGAYWSGDHPAFSRAPIKANRSYTIVSTGKVRWIKEARCDNEARFFSIELNELPLPENYESWPPTKLSEFIAWLHSDHKSKNQWIKKLELKIKALSRGKKCNKPLKIGSILLFNNPISDNPLAQIIFAISFTLDVRLLNALLGGRTRFITSMSENISIQRYGIERADPEYVYGRNMPNLKPPFHNKRIIVIGAGAIGGFLTSQLTCLGAGSGKRGQLLVVDHDTLKPGNIGRHYLGMEYLSQHKAKAVVTALSKSHPDLNIDHISERFESITNQLSGDLIVNATGMQTVGVALEKLLASNSTTPILHAWVEGQGAGARTLLNDKSNSACFRCLWEDSESGEYRPTIPLLRPDSTAILTPAGCHESYYAYPVMAAVKAATLATETILDFFNGNPEPRLRNLIIRKDQCLDKTSDGNPKKSDLCPACQSFPGRNS